MYLEILTYVLQLSNGDKTFNKHCRDFTNVVNTSFAHCIKYYFTCKYNMFVSKTHVRYGMV